MKWSWMKEKNNNKSENTKTSKNNLQTILEHNKHDYINIDPKINNDNQEQSTNRNNSRPKQQANKNNNKLKQLISVLKYLIGNTIGRNGNWIKPIQTQNNVIIQIKYCKDRTESLSIEGKKENVN